MPAMKRKGVSLAIENSFGVSVEHNIRDGVLSSKCLAGKTSGSLEFNPFTFPGQEGLRSFQPLSGGLGFHRPGTKLMTSEAFIAGNRLKTSVR